MCIYPFATPGTGANPVTGYVPDVALGTALGTVAINQVEGWMARALGDHRAGDEQGGPGRECGSDAPQGLVLIRLARTFAPVSGLRDARAQARLSDHLQVLFCPVCAAAGQP